MVSTKVKVQNNLKQSLSRHLINCGVIQIPVSRIHPNLFLVLDTAKTTKGFLSLKAFLLTPMAIKIYKEGEFHAEAIRNLKVSHDTLFQEVPIVIKNSHLVNELLLELSEQIPVEAGSQFLDLGSANVLEDQLKFLMETVDELNQESIKFNKYQNMAVKQCQDKTRWIQKRQVENTARSARGKNKLEYFGYIW